MDATSKEWVLRQMLDSFTWNLYFCRFYRNIFVHSSSLFLSDQLIKKHKQHWRLRNISQLTSLLLFSRYFFLVLIALVGIGLVNGLFFFPVMLSLVGPRGEVVPLSHPDRISTPSPEPVRRSRAPKCRVAPPPRRHTHAPTHACHREPSLTTITEEPSWHSQHEPETTQTIVVEPEFVVETTTCSHPHVSI